jgi:hypothetical protein
MKRNELTDGMIVAYKRERTDYPDYIYKGIVRSPEENGGYRNGGKLSVKLELPNDRPDTPNGVIWVQLWQIMGDYDKHKADLDLRQANQKIARLQREIEDRQIRDKMNRLAPIFAALGIRDYNIRKEFKGRDITITMTTEQFETIAEKLRQHPLIEEANEHLRNRLHELYNAQTTESENA